MLPSAFRSRFLLSFLCLSLVCPGPVSPPIRVLVLTRQCGDQGPGCAGCLVLAEAVSGVESFALPLAAGVGVTR
jgi:hypothetical protein